MAQKELKLFFDFDGTLLDVAPRHYRVYSEVVNELNGQPLDQPTYWSQKRQKTNWATLLYMSKLPAEVEPIFLEKFIKKIESPENLQTDTLFSGINEMLGALKADGYTCYLVSLRRQPERLQEQLKGLGIYKNFNTVLSGHSENSNPDIKIGLIKPLLGENAGVIIGDTEADILAGKALAMTTVAVLSGVRDKQFLESVQPDYIVEYANYLPKIVKGLPGS